MSDAGSFTNERVRIAIDDDGVADVMLTRADKLNALDDAMIGALLDAGEALSQTPGLRCVVLSGEGKAFCAGIDMAVLTGKSGSPPAPLDQRTHGDANRFQQLAMQFRRLPVPVIAAIHGPCFGAGLQIAAGADIRIARPDARLAIMEMRWGIVPDLGGFVLWRDIVRADVLRKLTLTGAEISGEQALAHGLVTELSEEPLVAALAMAREIAMMNPDAVRAAMRLFTLAQSASTSEILLAESREQMRLMGSANQREAVGSRMERRRPNFT